MGTHLLKRALDRPTGREPTDYLFSAEVRIGSVKVLIPTCALNIADKDPANGHQTRTGLIPMPRTADQLNAAVTASILTDRRRGKFTVSYYYSVKIVFVSNAIKLSCCP